MPLIALHLFGRVLGVSGALFLALSTAGEQVAYAASEGAASEPVSAPPPALDPPDASAAAPPIPAPPPPPPRRPRESKAVAAPASSALRRAPSAAAATEVQSARDGFYLRLNLGAAYGRTLVQSDRISVPDVTSNGLGVALDVYAGWSLSRGVVLGPAFSYSGQNDPHASIGSGASAAGKSQSAALGVFVDAFPNPRLGAHFGGVLALASLTQSVSGHPELTDYSGGGLGFDVFAGYDIALGGKWCLGGLLRLGGTATTASTDVDQHALKRQGTNYGVALLVSVSRY